MGIQSSINCLRKSIIYDIVLQDEETFHSATVTYPDGSTQLINVIPAIIQFTLDGEYSIVAEIDDGKGSTFFQNHSSTVSCSPGYGCGNLLSVYDCVDLLNTKYEELKCNNDKAASIEKIKLDRVLQLLTLSYYDCECSMGDINEYIKQIESIANCYDCEKSLSNTSTGAYGCTDPLAFNYSSYASSDDGSCLYAQNCVEVTMLDGSLKSETSIPDPFFKAWLENQGFGNGVLDGKVCIANLTGHGISINIDGSSFISSITDFSGIEDFENINGYVNISNAAATSLDFSNLFPSMSLGMYVNQCYNLSSANFTNTTASFIQMVRSTSLTSINVTGANIAGLYISGASSLNISGITGLNTCTNLYGMELRDCGLTGTLDLPTLISNISLFSGLNVYGNSGLTKIILGSNLNLSGLALDARECHANLEIVVGTAARVTLANSLFTVGQSGNVSTGTTFIA